MVQVQQIKLHYMGSYFILKPGDKKSSQGSNYIVTTPPYNI